jgi:Zn-dependent protease with chaperone function
MRVAAVLAAYGLILLVIGPRVLARAGWTSAAPRLAIAAWQALCCAVLASGVLAGLALAVPTIQVSSGLADALRACVMAVRAQYASPGGLAVSSTGFVLALGLLARCAWCLGAGLARARRARTRHLQTLAVVGRDAETAGVTVLPDQRPIAYCLPGWRHRIVLTSGALRTLDAAELDAVIAHERAHIRQRHHLAVAFTDSLAVAFPRIEAFRVAATETRRLVELAADDVAAARTERLTLAEALLAIAPSASPVAALTADGDDVAQRVRRLIAGTPALSRPLARGGAVLALLLVMAPFAVAVEPAFAATSMNLCPLASAPAHTPTGHPR